MQLKYKFAKRYAAFAAAALLTLSGGTAAYAGPSGEVSEEQMTEERKAQLADKVVEFDEIADRIELYNQTYRNTLLTINSSAINSAAAHSMAEEADSLMEDARDVKEADRLLYEEYKSAARELRRLAAETGNKDLSGQYERKLRQVKNNLTKSVEDVLIQYQQTEANRQTAQIAQELAAQGYKSAQDSYGLGLAATSGVLSAAKGELSAENSVQKLDAGLQTLRQTLQVLLGYGADEPVTFSPVPEPDPERIAHLDLNADTDTAIASNYTLMDTRSASAKGTRARGIKKRTVENSKQEIRSAMENLYQEILSKKQAYEAAQTAFSAAQASRAAAERKWSLGMLNRAQYLQEQMSYAQAEGAKTSASLALVKALNDYEWGRAGLITIG